MRCAAANMIITGAIMQHIFRTVYMPGTGCDAADLLVELFEDDQERQNICRCQLLQTSASSTNDQDIIFLATNQAYDLLVPWVPKEKQPLFQEQLEQHFITAVNIWYPRIQTSERLILATETRGTDPGVGLLDCYGARTNAQNQDSGTLASLTPRVVLDGTDIVLHHGTVLWNDQKAVLSARAESHRQSGAMNVSAGRRSRQASIHSPTAPAFARPR